MVATEPGTAVGGSDRRAQQRERILAAAERLLVDNGVERTRLRDVADAAGVSIGTVQHYFDTRDRLVAELFEWSATRRLDAWISSEPEDRDPWRRIETLLEHALAEPLFARSRVWIEFVAMARNEGLRARLAVFYDAWRRPFREAIEQGIAEGIFRPALETGALVDLLIMAVDGAEIAVALDVPSLTPERGRSYLHGAARSLLGVDRTRGDGRRPG